MSLTIADIVSELWRAAQQKRLDIRPRVRRGFKYSFVRAWTTIAQARPAGRGGDRRTSMPGARSLYTTFTGYDEVAHHSGIRERPETR